MGYYEIDNLYKNQDILLFKECYAMEKIHGTSAHILYKDGEVSFFSGGEKYEKFVKLFNKEELEKRFKEISPPEVDVCVYGEAYGGKCQGMSHTYGPNLKFVTFEVRIGYTWLSVPKAEDFCTKLGLEFIHYIRIPTTLEAINAERDAPSVQAMRNGLGGAKLREGIVLRPLEEVTKNNGQRIIAKHKRDEFRETRTPRDLSDKLIRKTKVKEIVDEWVTEERLNHILTSGKVVEEIQSIGEVIKLMIEDIIREGRDEIEDSADLRKAIGRETALMFKRRLQRVRDDLLNSQNT